MPILPKFTAWPEQHVQLDGAGLLAAYNAGWQGVYEDKDAEEELRAWSKQACGYASVGEAAHDRGWADSGAGKLVPAFLHVTKRWPDCWPGDAQTVGSCVSHSTRNGLLLTLGCELAAGIPDPATGEVEGAPDVPPEGIKSGVLSPAPVYWARNYSSHGWSCPTAARVVVSRVGCVVMKNYDELGVDLTNINRNIECLYGSKQPPEEWQAEFKKHLVHGAAECTSFEEVRDALYNGYGISSCGSEGWSSSRDENGFSRRSGSWAHALGYIAADDRPEIKQKYGEPLVCILNSWGPTWNSGPRRILGTSIDIPPGAYWAKWSDCKRRYAVAFSNVKGWPPQKLPDWGYFSYTSP